MTKTNRYDTGSKRPEHENKKKKSRKIKENAITKKRKRKIE